MNKCITALIVGMVAGSAPAATHNVALGQSIQTVIDGASPGDIIQLADGTFSENLTIPKSIEIRSANMAFLEGVSGNQPVISIVGEPGVNRPVVTLRKLSIQIAQVASLFGGGLRARHADVSIHSSYFKPLNGTSAWGSAVRGAGACFEGCTALIQDTGFWSLSAQYGGGIYAAQTELEIIDSSFGYLEAMRWQTDYDVEDGLLYEDPSLLEQGLTALVEEPTAGGALYLVESQAYLEDCASIGCSSNQGGFVYCSYSSIEIAEGDGTGGGYVGSSFVPNVHQESHGTTGGFAITHGSVFQMHDQGLYHPSVTYYPGSGVFHFNGSYDVDDCWVTFLAQDLTLTPGEEVLHVIQGPELSFDVDLAVD